MESVRNWLEQTIGMPIDYICIIIMGMLTLHVLIRIAIHGNMEFLKKYGKSGNDTEKKSMIPLKKGTTHRLHDSTFFLRSCQQSLPPNVILPKQIFANRRRILK